MVKLSDRLLDYLERLSGERPVLVPEPAAGLPLFLRSRYKINSVRVFGRRFLLALEAEDRDPGSPGEYQTQAEQLGSHLREPPVLVLAALDSYARNRMVRLGIPFIVPGSQAFLPNALLDLRERQPQPGKTRGRTLTPAAQCLVLYHLQRESLAATPLQEIARKIGYSPIMLTKVRAELEFAGLCESVRDRRATLLRFAHEGRKLWERALPLLSRPDRSQHWIQWEKPRDPALLAGMSALSRRSMIEDDRLPTYAVWQRSVRSHLEQGLYRRSRGREEANLRLEGWTYNPLTLGGKGMVDPLSLYLSLRDSPDERVQQQIQKLVEDMSW